MNVKKLGEIIAMLAENGASGFELRDAGKDNMFQMSFVYQESDDA